jgi:circadian clock protein KaiB
MSGISFHNARPPEQASSQPWVLKLFVTRQSAASAMAIVQLRRIKEEYLPAHSTIEIIDIFEEPGIADEEQILAIPTLVRKSPLPIRRIIGDLSDIAVVLTSIGFLLKPESSPI